jgi:hypothetical protein
MSNSDLELFGDSFGAVSSPTQHPGSNQGYHHVARAEQPGGSPRMGWASPTASQFTDSLQGHTVARDSPVRCAAELYPAEPSKEDMVAELARLKAMVADMSDRLGQTGTVPAPNTPPMAQPVRHQTAPRKRTASRVADIAVSPSKRQQQVVPSQVSNSPGPIEAMWSPGVTPEQRRVIFDNKMHFTGPIAGAMSPPSFFPPNVTTSPAAISNDSSTPTHKATARKSRTSASQKSPASKRTPAPKKLPKAQPQHQRTQSAPILPTFTGMGIDTLKFLTPQASRPGDRPISELYKASFMSLGTAEKARLLLPLLEGNDPATGKKWAEPGSLGKEMLVSSSPTASSAAFGSNLFLSSPLSASPSAARSTPMVAPLMSMQPLSAQTPAQTPAQAPAQSPAQSPPENTGIPSYSNFNTWYVGLKKAPVIQTATQQASFDGDSQNDLYIQTPAFTQTLSNDASVLTPSLFQPLVTYVQNGVFYAPPEKHSASDASNSGTQLQDINATSTQDGSSDDLLEKFNTQHTFNKQGTFGDPETTEFNFSDFINDDASTSDVPAKTSDASNDQAFFALLNNAVTNNGVSASLKTEATSDDMFVRMNPESASNNFFDPLNTESNNNDLFTPINTHPAMGDHFGSLIPDDNPFALCDINDMATNNTFSFDHCTLFDSSADFSHMIQQATAQIQAPNSGAVRQREALVEHERRVFEGRRC